MVAIAGQMRSASSRVGRWLFTPEGVGIVGMLVVAALFRLMFAASVQLTEDLHAIATWGELIRFHFFHAYSYGGTATNPWVIPVYPPFAMYVFGGVEAIYIGAAHLIGLNPSTCICDPTFVRVIKLPAIVADLALMALAYTFARRTMSHWRALLAVATYAFTPVILIDVLVWGQTDGIVLLLAALALVQALNRRSLATGVFLGLLVTFKLQAPIFVPLALVYLLRWAGWRSAAKAIATMAGTAVVIWSPYLLPPHPEIFAWRHNLSVTLALEGSGASHTAFNLWWLLGMQGIGIRIPAVGPFPLILLSGLLFGIIMVVVCVGIWQDASPGRLWAGAALVGLGFFDVGVLQFERYIFPAIGLFLLAAIYNWRYWLFYAVTSVTGALNWLRSMTICGCRLQHPLLLHKLVSLNLQPWENRDIAAMNVGILIAAVVVYLRSSRTSLTAPAVSGVGTNVGATGNASVPAAQSASKTAFTASTVNGLKGRLLRRDPYISVVIPCYNEEGNILPMHERLTRVLGGLTSTYEIVFVNNGSYDGSALIFDELVAGDPHVSVLTLSRNFGSQGAYTGGLEYASGDCVICIDGDIQDPPELIPEFVQRWLDGYDVVYGVRVRRKGSWMRRAGYKVFYRLLRRLSYIDIPVDAGDFSLMDRRVVDVINAMPERSRLIRGLRAWAGFHQTGVPYVREERYSGRTSNSFLGLFRWASLGLVSFSYAPLDLISYLAAGVVALSAIALGVYMVLYFSVPNAPRGFQTLLVITLFLGGVQLLCLSIIGTYLARIFEEIKARPKFLTQSIQNDHRKAHGEGAHEPAAHGRQTAHLGG